jgi:hypothetical protein
VKTLSTVRETSAQGLSTPTPDSVIDQDRENPPEPRKSLEIDGGIVAWKSPEGLGVGIREADSVGGGLQE